MKKAQAHDLLAEIAALALPELPTPMELVGDFVVCSDVHNPFTDYAFARRVAQVGRREKIDSLIIAGDWWDYSRYSHFPATVVPPTWGQERAAGKALAREYADTFKTIFLLMGNHDRRKVKLLAGEEDDADVFAPLASVANIRTSNLGWCIVHSGAEVWRITHPKNYSRNPLTVANALALKYDCHVMSGHEHHVGWTVASDGEHTLVNLGTLADENKFAYVHMDDSTSPRMKKGFAMLRDGFATVYSDRATDWGVYERPANRTRRGQSAAGV